MYDIVKLLQDMIYMLENVPRLGCYKVLHICNLVIERLRTFWFQMKLEGTTDKLFVNFSLTFSQNLIFRYLQNVSMIQII